MGGEPTTPQNNRKQPRECLKGKWASTGASS